MVKKMVKYSKFVLCIALILSLVAPSYAALSASDGSAFVTKAEFDSALADFNARLTTFEAGINSKIDSQVTSYLDRNGIWNKKVVSLKLEDGSMASEYTWEQVLSDGWIKNVLTEATLNQHKVLYTSNDSCIVANKSGLMSFSLKNPNSGYMEPYHFLSASSSGWNPLALTWSYMAWTIRIECVDTGEVEFVHSLWGGSGQLSTDATAKVIYDEIMIGWYPFSIPGFFFVQNGYRYKISECWDMIRYTANGTASSYTDWSRGDKAKFTLTNVGIY